MSTAAYELDERVLKKAATAPPQLLLAACVCCQRMACLVAQWFHELCRSAWPTAVS